MRQVRHAGEGRAALEVDEDEVELLGRVREGEGEHKGAQHLRLTGTGRTDEQAVRTHTLLRGFLNVKEDGDALGSNTEGDAQAVPTNASHPGLLGVKVSNVTQVQQLQQINGSLDVGTPNRRFALLGSLVGCEGSQTARDGLSLGLTDAFPLTDDGLVTEKVNFEHAPRLTLSGRVHEKSHSGGTGQGTPFFVEINGRHPNGTLWGTQLGRGRKLGSVTHEEDMRPGGKVVARRKSWTINDIGTEQIQQINSLGHDHAGGSNRI